MNGDQRKVQMQSQGLTFLTGTLLNRDPTEGVKVKDVLICQEQYPLMLWHRLPRLLDALNTQHYFVSSMLRVGTMT